MNLHNISMRKIIVSMNVTLDGFMSGPGTALDWHLENWDDEMAACIAEQLSAADTILFGRVTYSAMETYWASVALNWSTAREDIAFAAMLNEYSKIVFSKKLCATTWNNTKIVKGILKNEIADLRKQNGKHLMVYGSGQLATALINFNLVDEFSIWVHPVVIGKGKSFFSELHQRLNLKLSHSKVFNTGVILLYYKATNKIID
jgi:dihydrofolate reductase